MLPSRNSARETGAVSIVETANAVSNLIRNVVGAGIICVIGYGGGWLYTTMNPQVQLQQKQRELEQAEAALVAANEQVTLQHRRIQDLDRSLYASQQQVARLDTSLRLMKVTHRVAEITVLQQRQRESGKLVTSFQFQEMDAQGIPLDQAHRFEIEGDLLYLEYWVVKFRDEFVEQGSEESPRSSSLCLFRRMFGEHQEPYEGFTIDRVGERPRVYGGTAGGESLAQFQRELWSQFWDIANDPQRAATMGIRAAHAVAPAMRIRAGQRYRITLRASDGLSIQPVQLARDQPLQR